MTLNVAAWVGQPLQETRGLDLSFICIGLFEKARSCGLTVSRIQIAKELQLIIRVASDWFRMLQVLPESTSTVVEILPIMIGMFRSSVARSL